MIAKGPIVKIPDFVEFLVLFLVDSGEFGGFQKVIV